MYSIKKIFKFETAHILSNSYSEECQNFHGHSYKLEVIVQSEKLNSSGVVIDFKLLKEIITPIIKKLDHKCLVNSKVKATEHVQKMLENRGMIFVQYNPTAENMIKYLYDEINKFLYNYKIKLNLWETETGCVSYTDDKEKF